MVWKFQKLNWKFDWRETMLDIAYYIDKFLWFTLVLIAGAWAVTDNADLLDALRRNGRDMFMLWAGICFGFDLLRWVFEQWLDRKEGDQP
jgi:hypothetical protein